MPAPLALLASPLLGLAGKLIDKLFTTPEEKAAAQLRVLELEQSGQLKELEISMSAIVAEAQSDDKWTSRARPSFLYIIYAIIVLCFVGAIAGLAAPAAVAQVSTNLTSLLGAIPESLWWLFGAGSLGYTGGRSFDKWKSNQK